MSEDKSIVRVEMDAVRAWEWADRARELDRAREQPVGHTYRVRTRTVRADGASVPVFVVVRS